MVPVAVCDLRAGSPFVYPAAGEDVVEGINAAVDVEFLRIPFSTPRARAASWNAWQEVLLLDSSVLIQLRGASMEQEVSTQDGVVTRGKSERERNEQNGAEVTRNLAMLCDVGEATVRQCNQLLNRSNREMGTH